MSSASVEDYLRVIHSFNEKGQSAKTTELAEKLDVSPPSVSEMIKKLADEGLVDYEPYRGVSLTTKGLVAAQKIVRKHRLLERFLHDMLGVKREKVHEEACRLEHSLSDEVADALCRKMDAPETCPDDGSPIPPCVLDVADCSDCEEAAEKLPDGDQPVTQLSTLRTGDEATVEFIRGGESASKRLLDMGLTPGTPVTVVGAAPFKGPIEVSVRGTMLAVGRGLASHVIVRIRRYSHAVVGPVEGRHRHHHGTKGRA